MKFLKTIHDRNLTLPTMLIFGYMFAPMIFSQAPANMQGDIVYAIPDLEEATVSPLLRAEPLGQGGPIESLIFGSSIVLDQDIEPEPEPVEVTRLNKLNYTNAIYPVFPMTISSNFGWREAPCDECSSDHKGVDLVPGGGSPIVAILDGMVVEAGVFSGFGTWVVVEHLVASAERDGTFEKWQSLYAHLQADSIPDNVAIGTVVKKGQLLGLVGSTGVSTGNHLHFEIIIDGVPVDPIPLMAKYTTVEILPDGAERFIGYK